MVVLRIGSDVRRVRQQVFSCRGKSAGKVRLKTVLLLPENDADIERPDTGIQLKGLRENVIVFLQSFRIFCFLFRENQ